MLKKLLFASLLTAICTAELTPIANYDPGCFATDTITSALVNDKLYVFGTCLNGTRELDIEPRSTQTFYEAIGSTQVYDIAKDEWSFETETPAPIKYAGTVVVGNSIYFYDIKGYVETENYKYDTVSQQWISYDIRGYVDTEMYKYDTVSKQWTSLPKFPFEWTGDLVSCYDGQSKIYFTSSLDGRERHITHVYDTSTEKWIKAPIFGNKGLLIRQMICQKDHIKLVGKELKSFDEDVPFVIWSYLELFSMSYIDGQTISDEYQFARNPVHLNFLLAYEDYIFFSDTDKTKQVLYRLNTLTFEHVAMATLPSFFDTPVLTPLNTNEFWLLSAADVNDKREYNHKIVFEHLK